MQVLFARAMQSAGLKTITSKHLSLAAQCLSFLDALCLSFLDALVLNPKP
ncbi:hypothetical protein T484DRAFT_1858528 [Baffinella frigidus]|nr:hypothetical protein T484DRAFT_1858528 [Cryptophyta sp. CCMP2293]